MALVPGDVAPDFELQTPDGRTVALGDVLHSRHNVLLVFLRHLG
jgi:peroxiredoxin